MSCSVIRRRASAAEMGPLATIGSGRRSSRTDRPARPRGESLGGCRRRSGGRQASFRRAERQSTRSRLVQTRDMASVMETSGDTITLSSRVSALASEVLLATRSLRRMKSWSTPSSSTTGRWLMSCRLIRYRASPGEMGSAPSIGSRLAMVSQGSSREIPRSTARRMSPSVRRPTAFSSRAERKRPRPRPIHLARASAIDASGSMVTVFKTRAAV